MIRISRFVLAVLTGLLLQLAPSVRAEGVGPCPEAEDLPLNTALRGPGALPGVRDCYRVTVTSPGLLALHLSDLGGDGTEPRLAFLGKGPMDGQEAGGFQVARRTPRGAIVEVEAPGTFLLFVASEDARRPLAGYKLRTAYVADEDTTSGGGGPFLEKAPCPPAEDVDKKDCDPIELRLGTRLFALCDLPRGGLPGDDHGDTPLCATPLRPGESVSGTLDGVEGDDEDFFTFALDELRTVEVELLGEAEAYHLALYGDDGLRLEASATGRLAKTLPPGRYHLRLLRSGFASWGDSYVLDLRVLDEP